MKKILLPISFILVVSTCIAFAYFTFKNSPSNFPLLPQQKAEIWDYDSSNRITTVVADQDQVYICEESVGVSAFNRLTGEKNWTQTVPCPHNDLLILENSDSVVSASYPKDDKTGGTFAMNTKTGDILWQKSIQGINPQVEFESDLIFEEIVNDSSRVFSLNAETGQENWSVTIPGKVLGGLSMDTRNRTLVVKKTAFFPGELEQLLAIQADTGEKLWQTSWPNDVFNSADHFEVFNGQVYVFFNNTIHVYNLTTGQQMSTVKYPGIFPFGEFIIHDDKPVFISNFLNPAFATDLSTGQVSWEFSLPFEDVNFSAITKSEDLLTGSDNLLLLIDIATGTEKWRLQLDGAFIGYEEIEEILYIAVRTEKSSHLLLVDLQSGKILKRIEFEVGESPYDRGVADYSKLVIFDDSILLESSNIFEVLESKNFDDLQSKIEKYNLTSGNRVMIERVGLGLHSVFDEYGFIQYDNNRMLSHP